MDLSFVCCDQIFQPLDVFVSHDWPVDIMHWGNVDRLLQQKPFFRNEVSYCLRYCGFSWFHYLTY